MADNNQAPDDRYAKESFSMRRMTKWQLWSITIVAAVVVVALIAYVA